jgi:hypothetical protein
LTLATAVVVLATVLLNSVTTVQPPVPEEGIALLPAVLVVEPLKVTCAEAVPTRQTATKSTKLPNKVKFFLIMRLSF